MKQEYSIENDVATAFTLYCSKTRSQVNRELGTLCSRLSELNLHPLLEYALMSEGKRLRPLLVVLSAESVGGNRNKVMSLALAFELMHTATLVHDDIIDHDDIRRGKLALHKEWSVNDAILTGDALIALAIELASGYGETILKTVAQSALELCDGEHMDITIPLKMPSEKWYFTKIKEKSASLFRAATLCGSLAGGGTPSEVRSLALFGENFGFAYQLRDDLLDLTSKGTQTPKDLKDGRITLPLIHHYRVSSAAEKKQIENKLANLTNANCPTYNETTENLLHAIRQTGSLDYCEKKMDGHLRLAVSNLSTLEDTPYKTYLVEMTRALKAMG